MRSASVDVPLPRDHRTHSRSSRRRAIALRSTAPNLRRRQYPTSQRHRPCGGATRPAALAVARTQDAQHVTWGEPTDADVDERADDRAHHLPAERRGTDLVAQHAVARVAPRASRGRAASVVDPAGPLRQKLAKSCSPRNGSAPRRSNRRSSGSGTHHAWRARNGSGHRPVHDRVAVRAPLRGVPRVEAVVDELRRAHDHLGPELRAHRSRDHVDVDLAHRPATGVLTT